MTTSAISAAVASLSSAITSGASLVTPLQTLTGALGTSANSWTTFNMAMSTFERLIATPVPNDPTTTAIRQMQIDNAVQQMAAAAQSGNLPSGVSPLVTELSSLTGSDPATSAARVGVIAQIQALQATTTTSLSSLLSRVGL